MKLLIKTTMKINVFDLAQGSLISFSGAFKHMTLAEMALKVDLE